jgi:DNA-binding NtrC family response regulator
LDNDGEGGTTIMVVDDQESVRRIARRLLARLGFRVVEAENAAAALQVLAIEKIALLISDVVMPGELDGVALARIAVERWPDIKIILTSGYPQGHIQSGGEPLQSDIRILSKPYRAEEFTNAVRDSLGQ